MSRKSLVCLLVSSLLAGCANLSPQLASEYCRVDGGSPCSALSGDGFCQPCPEAQMHEASGGTTPVR